jgi:hypothetical protein
LLLFLQVKFSIFEHVLYPSDELCILILRDESTPPSTVQTLFNQIPGVRTVCVNSPDDLPNLCETNIPRAIVIANRDSQSIDQVKFVRSKLWIDEIPIFAFNGWPSREDVSKLVITLIRNNR